MLLPTLLALVVPDVLLVDQTDPAAFLTIQAAVDAAQNGDTVVIAPGQYPSFLIDGKSLTLVADGDGVMAGDAFSSCFIRNLSASQKVVVSGLASGPFGVFSNAGEVWLESLEIVGATGIFSTGTLAIRGSSSVVLTDVDVQSGPSFFGSSAMSALESHVTAYDCRFIGLDGTEAVQSSVGGPGSSLVESEMYASGCVFQGGAGRDGSACASCTCSVPGGLGGDGLVLAVGSSIRWRDSSFLAGPGGAPDPCLGQSQGPGVPVAMAAGGGSLVPLAGILRQARVDSPVRTDENMNIEVLGSPLDSTFLLITASPTQLSITTPYIGQLFFAPGFTLLPIGGLDAQGTQLLQVPAFAIPLGAEAATMTLQPIFVDQFNGLLSLGGPSRAVLLDPMF